MTDVRTLPPPSAPMAVARELAQECYTDSSGTLTLHHWRGGWWRWRTARWVELEQRQMDAAAYRFTADAHYVSGEQTKQWSPNRRKIGDLLHALAAVVLLPADVSMPAWLDGSVYDGVLVSCASGLLDVRSRRLLEHTPLFFNGTSVPFAYDPGAGPPRRWHRFLNELWRSDGKSREALGEWFGYVISGRLDLHKILLLVGPTRAGKGVIARMLGELVGNENVAAPTLSSLNGDFGLAPLLGKSLAVVSDARLNGRNVNTVVERLLSVSGEDTLTVNRKYREQWTGKLPSRIMLCSNELPQLGDASAAIVGRFETLLLTESWLGKEDRELELALREELPGILNWSLAGLDRLVRQQGRFTKTPGASEVLVALQDLASPVGAFVRDRCVRQANHEVAVDILYNAWKTWSEDNGHARRTKQVFGRDLRAVVPGLRVTRVGGHDSAQRARAYQGIGLRDEE
jgi:putative DNA primase/helicase